MSCLTPTYNFQIYQGDTYNLIFTISGDRTASDAKLQVRTTPSAGTATLTKTDLSGIAVTYDAGLDVTLYQITFTTTDTSALVPTIVYSYDFQLTTGSDVKTWFGGTIGIRSEVTRP
jgi:hypothetical protein